MTTITQETLKQELLTAAETKFGFLPNVLRQMSDSPAALEIYMNGQAALAREGTRLTDKQTNLVQLATSQANDCNYCVAAHSGIGRMQGVDSSILDAVATGRPIAEADGANYVNAARLLMDKQGHLSGEDLAKLEQQGIDREVLFEIIGNIAVKTISNWVNHIARTKVDKQFREGA